VYTVNDADYKLHMDTQQEIYLQLYAAFAERGIEFAFPTQTLHVVDAGGARNPGRGFLSSSTASEKLADDEAKRA
jgi:small-conductance mechanosensitive channel